MSEPAYFELPDSKLAEFRAAVGDADTALAANAITQLYQSCTAHCAAKWARPALAYELSVDSAERATLRVEHVPFVDSACAAALLALGDQVCALRFVFDDERSGEPAPHATLQLTLWRAAVPRERRVRVGAEPVRAVRRRTLDIDFKALGAADEPNDCATLTELIEFVCNMRAAMPRVLCSAQRIWAHDANLGGDEATCSEHLEAVAGDKRAHNGANGCLKRARADALAAAAAEPDDAPPTHVGYCVFFENVPSFGADVLERLAERFGNRVLRAFVIAPSLWRARAKRAKRSEQRVPPTLAVCVRRGACREAEAGPVAVRGCARLARMLERAAHACAD